jgi:hypothetical protein
MVDYSPLGGVMPAMGLPFGLPYESSVPFVPPVDVFAMRWESPEAGDVFLYGDGGCFTDKTKILILIRATLLTIHPHAHLPGVCRKRFFLGLKLSR